ncbi:MAG: hypothetical protein IJS65_01605 [Clostridia bacterium]|nr:hypothetical protein [Clostridia bacterium]
MCDFLKNNRGLTRAAYERLAGKSASSARDLLSGEKAEVCGNMLTFKARPFGTYIFKLGK